MESSEPSIKSAEAQKVPDDLLQKLHRANQQFHQARQVLQQASDDSLPDHQKGIDQATEQVRVAEREVEKVTMEIHGSLKPPTTEPQH